MNSYALSICARWALYALGEGQGGHIRSTPSSDVAQIFPKLVSPHPVGFRHTQSVEVGAGPIPRKDTHPGHDADLPGRLESAEQGAAPGVWYMVGFGLPDATKIFDIYKLTDDIGDLAPRGQPAHVVVMIVVSFMPRIFVGHGDFGQVHSACGFCPGARNPRRGNVDAMGVAFLAASAAPCSCAQVIEEKRWVQYASPTPTIWRM
jgi:hypothetical protein